MASSVTIRVLAARAGLAPSTISIALRNDPRLPLATRQKVKALAKRLGYQPNALVAKLMAGVRRRGIDRDPQTLAYVICWHSTMAYYHFKSYRLYREGAAARAAEFGYLFEDFAVNPQALSTARLRKILRTRAIPGVLIAPIELHPESPANFTVPLDCRPHAVSTIGYSLRSPRVHRATHDHAQGIALAFRELREQGFRRIGFAFSREIQARVEGRWLNGFLGAQFGLPAPERVPPLLLEELGQMAPFWSWLQRHRPDALVVVELDHFNAAFAARAPSVEAGGAVAAPLLVHLDRVPEAPEWGIDQHCREVGAAAFDLLMAQIHRNEKGVPAMPRTIMLEGSWRAPTPPQKSEIQLSSRMELH